MQVSIVIIRQGERFWVHQRRANKRTYPNLWGIGIGGKVEPGENPRQAAIRELHEESGLLTSIVFLQEFSWDSPELSYSGYLFETRISPSDNITACTREFANTQWVTPEEIQQIKMSGQLCPDTQYFWDLYWASLKISFEIISSEIDVLQGKPDKTTGGLLPVG